MSEHKQQSTSTAQYVQDILHTRGLSCQVVEFATSTRTSQEAADAVGCQVAQIAKSLVFRSKRTHRPILVIASGANRVNEKRLKELIGEAVGKADAAFVREKTGFVIGGVPPVGHTEPLETFIDADLLRYDELWAAAGTPNAVFKLTPADLQRITGGQVVTIT